MSVDVEIKFTDPQVLLETFDKYIDRITEWLDQIEAFIASAEEAEATIAKEVDRIVATFPNGAAIQLRMRHHPDGKVLAASVADGSAMEPHNWHWLITWAERGK